MDKKRLLLTSDLHLGLNLYGKLPSDDERIATFKKICGLAIKHDVLLVAGDLIHSESINSSYIDIIKDEFGSLAESKVEVYYTPGRGELLVSGEVNPVIHGLGATHTFTDEDDVFTVKSGKGEIYINGLQYGSSSDFSKVSKEDGNGFYLGLFNAGFNPSADKAADVKIIGKDDIRKMNLDFYAMGGEHSFRVFRLSNRIIGAFAGSPEPCSFSETGDRFAISIELENGAIRNIKRIAVNTVGILCVDIDCAGLSGESELAGSIKSSLQQENIYIIRLTGSRDFKIGSLLKDELAGYFRGISIIDNTCPHLGILIDENSSGDDVQSYFFRKLSSKVSRETGKTTQVIAKALAGNSQGRRLFCDF